MRPGKTFATSHQYDQQRPGSALAMTADNDDGGGGGGGADGEGGSGGEGQGRAGLWRSTVALNGTGITGFFQAFMASTPRHELLRRYLDRLSAHYDDVDTSGRLGRFLGVYALGQVFAEWVGYAKMCIFWGCWDQFLMTFILV